jgi:glycosyltransferase involved in cell wall biosynthesis
MHEPRRVPRFSVVIPTYGRPALLGDALASVLGQTVDDFECLVVDDGSHEPPPLPADPRVRMVRRPTNGGPAAARNTGIAAATGRYVAFLDDDDVWAPERLTYAIAAHERAPVAICWQTTLGSRAKPAGRVLEGDVRDTILDSTIPHMGATSIERAAAPPFDEHYGTSEDVEWWLRVAQQLRVATTTAVGLCYRVHDGPRERTAFDHRDGQRLLDEHADWFARHPRAKAFRMKRMGLSALRVNDRRLARRCFAASLRLDPDARTAWHAVRALVPARGATGG